MESIKNFKKEAKASPLKLLAVSLMSIIIFIMALAVSLFSLPQYKTVTNFEECKEAGGSVSGLTCTINEVQFRDGFQINLPFNWR